MDIIRRTGPRRTAAPPSPGGKARADAEDPYLAYLAWLDEGRPTPESEPRSGGAIAVGVAPRSVLDHVQVAASATTEPQRPTSDRVLRWIERGRSGLKRIGLGR